MGEGVVRVRSQRAERVYDKENYIDFRMRLLGEPGELITSGYIVYTQFNVLNQVFVFKWHAFK